MVMTPEKGSCPSGCARRTISLVRPEVEDGYLPSPIAPGGDPWLWDRREVPVLNGSIVQVQFRGRRAAGACVLFTNAAHILFGRLLADGHPPGDGLHGHASGVKP